MQKKSIPVSLRKCLCFVTFFVVTLLFIGCQGGQYQSETTSYLRERNGHTTTGPLGLCPSSYEIEIIRNLLNTFQHYLNQGADPEAVDSAIRLIYFRDDHEHLRYFIREDYMSITNPSIRPEKEIVSVIKFNPYIFFVHAHSQYPLPHNIPYEDLDDDLRQLIANLPHIGVYVFFSPEGGHYIIFSYTHIPDDFLYGVIDMPNPNPDAIDMRYVGFPAPQ